MNKGLEALKRNRNFIERYFVKQVEETGVYHKDMKDKIFNDLSIVEKELKALEIIKETPEFAWYITIYENAYEMIADRKGFRVNESAEELQEEYELLREVLKDD